ncbi:hypothetical protein SH580_19045 [Coraliomargarita algicola]|uniref:Response regulatory domain-containing protein n=1 Tax=Coraliomargarita algicola TaxID=3092156 RepID=A0ABZ0RJ12_9BACT|nr:hypothetical protein [Coraliomargarita sp. J2-16]WPJ95517.1 hypothetical protein SH580_19045 [Coraliomargarita sp. J2-16]
MIENTIQIADCPPVSPQGLVPFRRFAEALSEFNDFDGFRQALARVVQEDSGYAGFLDLDADLASMQDSEVGEHFEMDSLVVPLSAGHDTGYIRFLGNEQGRPFDAEDLMWMGAISEFVSLAYANAKMHRESQDKARIFQYLINQLPLGVICFSGQGDLIVENKLASRLLGAVGTELMQRALADESFKSQGNLRLHLEVEGRLVYTEGRRLEVEAGLSFTAFVLHDMSAQREKLMLQIERSVFRAESRGQALTIAVLEDRSEAGKLLRILKASAGSLQLDPVSLASLDAYSCACIFADKSLRSVRYLLKKGLAGQLKQSAVVGALVSQVDHLDEAPAQSLIRAARADFQRLDQLLRPSLLVFDPYPAVIEALDLISSELCSFESIDAVRDCVSLIERGQFDGIFLDVDTFAHDGLKWLEEASAVAGAGFRVFYISHLQPTMVRSKFGLSADSMVFQKPFDADVIRDALLLQFDFA